MRRSGLILTVMLAGFTLSSFAQDIEISAGVIDTRRGEVKTTIRGGDRLQRLLILQKWLLAQLLHDMGMEVTLVSKAQRKVLETGVRSLDELETLGAALEAMDRGDFVQARALLRQLPSSRIDLVRELLEKLPDVNVEGLSAREVVEQVADRSASIAWATAGLIVSGSARQVLAEAMAPEPVEMVRQPEILIPEILERNRFIPAEQAQTGEFYSDP